MYMKGCLPAAKLAHKFFCDSQLMFYVWNESVKASFFTFIFCYNFSTVHALKHWPSTKMILMTAERDEAWLDVRKFQGQQLPCCYICMP